MSTLSQKFANLPFSTFCHLVENFLTLPNSLRTQYASGVLPFLYFVRGPCLVFGVNVYAFGHTMKFNTCFGIVKIYIFQANSICLYVLHLQPGLLLELSLAL